MKTANLIYITAALLTCSMAQLSRGEDPSPSPRPNREELREKLKGLTPEERAAKIKEFREKHPQAGPAVRNRLEQMQKAVKELGLDPQELRQLPPEERRARVKEAADKKIAELEKKKSAGTLADADNALLQRLEQRKKMIESRRGAGDPSHPNRPGAEKPAVQ